MNKILFVLLILGGHAISAQESIRVELKNEMRVPRLNYNPLPLYVLPEDHRITYGDSVYIVEGVKQVSKELAFSFEYFTGWEKPAVARQTLMVVANYKSEAPMLYVDYNHNLDISDDGPPKKFKGHNEFLSIPLKEYTLIDLKRTDNKEAKYTLRITHHLDRVQGLDPKFLSFVSDHPFLKNNKLTDKAFWLGSRRQNIRSASVEINGLRLQLGVMDWDCDGFYNDPEDRVLIGTYGSETLSSSEKDGAVKIGEEPLLMINGQVYELIYSDAIGRFIDLKKSAKQMPYSLKEGDILSDMEFKLIDGTQSSLYQYLEPGKFTLIDVWGSWCKPCVASIPEQKQLYSQFKSKVNVIGLAAYDRLANTKNLVEEKEIPWPNGIATDQIIHSLMVEGYPYYVLLDDSGKVLKLGTHKIEEVYAVIKNIDHED